MTVTRQERDQMSSFMRALNAEPLQESVVAHTAAPTIDPNVITRNPVGTESQRAMKDILSRFYGAAEGREQLIESVDNTAKQINQDARYDRELREALMTERTERGSRIGDWEIHVREDGKRKFFDVVQHGTDVCIASDLLLYEAAQGLVRILNGGGKLNSKDAVALLRAEQDYAGALNNAVLYKHYMVKNPYDVRRGIFESRYSDAKGKALKARDIVCEIAERV